MNDQVRKRQYESSQDATKDSDKHSVFMGKNYLENLQSIKHTGKNLTMKQMFDISEKLIVDNQTRSLE